MMIPNIGVNENIASKIIPGSIIRCIHGKAVFEDNKGVKEGCMNNPIVKGQYQTADNPIFEVFYLENPHGIIADFSGNPPYEF